VPEFYSKMENSLQVILRGKRLLKFKYKRYKKEIDPAYKGKNYWPWPG